MPRSATVSRVVTGRPRGQLPQSSHPPFVRVPAEAAATEAPVLLGLRPGLVDELLRAVARLSQQHERLLAVSYTHLTLPTIYSV